MNVRVLVVFVLVVVVPIAIGLYWIVANSKDFTVVGFTAFSAYCSRRLRHLACHCVGPET